MTHLHFLRHYKSFKNILHVKLPGTKNWLKFFLTYTRHESHNTLSPSLFFFPVAATLEHRAFVKCFLSLQFLNPKTVFRTP
jgi:hypothetical protein